MSKFNITQLLGIFHLQLKHLKSKISHGTFTHGPTPGPNPIDITSYNGTPWQRQLEYPAMEQVVALAAPSSR